MAVDTFCTSVGTCNAHRHQWKHPAFSGWGSSSNLNLTWQQALSSMVSPHRATLRSAEGVDCALPDGKVPQKSDSLKSLGLEPRLSDFSQKWATISGCIFFRVPRFRVHASERENKTHTHTTRAKKGPVWLFLKRAPGGIKRGRGNPTNRPIRPASWLARSAFPYLAEVGEKKG